MKSHSLGLVLAGCFWLLSSLASAQEGERYHLEIEGRFWRPMLDAKFRIVESGMGVDVKAVDDLGMPREANFGEIQLQLKFGRSKFNFDYLPLSWSGDNRVTRTAQIRGVNYIVQTRIQSKLELDFFKGGFEYDFIVGNYGFLGVTADVLITHFDVGIHAPEMGLNYSENGTVLFGLVGLIGRVYPVRWLNLTFKLSGLPMGHYGYLLDAEGSLNINPVRYVGISAGFRYLDLQAEYLDNLNSLKLNGPFVALLLRF